MKDFQKKVICIKTSKRSRLSLGKIYTASECYIPSIGHYPDHYTIDNDYNHMYPRSMFIDLKEYRKEKLKKLLLKINEIALQENI